MRRFRINVTMGLAMARAVKTGAASRQPDSSPVFVSLSTFN
jgi:hypothetical protein